MAVIFATDPLWRRPESLIEIPLRMIVTEYGMMGNAHRVVVRRLRVKVQVVFKIAQIRKEVPGKRSGFGGRFATTFH